MEPGSEDRGCHAISGAAVADLLVDELRPAISRLREAGNPPGLATVSVGSDYAAAAYERRLRHLAEDLGCRYVNESLDADVEQADALALIGKLNADPRITGILILRPLPVQLSEADLYRTLDPAKDIECVHPHNAGLVALGQTRFSPSTPASAFLLLDEYVASSGRDRRSFYEAATIVLVGRSNNVGKPAMWMGLERNATVISCDHHTDKAGKLERYTTEGDVLIVAAGVPGLITADHVREGAIVIDVGINPVPEPATGRIRLVGDVDYDSAATKAEAISTVPGGVGPITDIWLLGNTVEAAQHQRG